eukprot:GHVL01025915.1.p1 GENE.GHVL01025915.1~~GHVL01025915.1.p1  ORF type:complete len:396 (+),score=92.35 GHVL01025915.1:31-1218(+)
MIFRQIFKYPSFVRYSSSSPFWVPFSEKIGYIGKCKKSEVCKIIHENKIKSLLYLCTSDEDQQIPSDVCNENGVEFKHYPISNNNLNTVSASALEGLIGSMPKPILIQCKTGRRASAAACIYAASQGYDEIYKTLNFIDKPDLVKWVRSYIYGKKINKNNSFIQLFDSKSSTYTYIISCINTRECIIIDPVKNQIERDLNILSKYSLKPKYAINTHIHADHITGTGDLKRILGVPTVIGKLSTKAKSDMYVGEGEKLYFGNSYITVIETPGHTSGCISLLLDDESKIFTGDCLLIGGCGRADFVGGDSNILYDSINKILKNVDSECYVYPGHNYEGILYSTIYEENVYNKRVRKFINMKSEIISEDEFVGIMNNLNITKPHGYEDIVKANFENGV